MQWEILGKYPDYQQLFDYELDTMKEEYERAFNFHTRLDENLRNLLVNYLGSVIYHSLNKEYFTNFKNTLLLINRKLRNIIKRHYEGDDEESIKIKLERELGVNRHLIKSYVPKIAGEHLANEISFLLYRFALNPER